MPRAFSGLAAAFALLSVGAAPAQSSNGGLEMDVMDLGEAPDHAIKRMGQSSRSDEEEGSGRTGRPPDIAPFIPEDSLGSRGLTGIALDPVTDPVEAERPRGPGVIDLDELRDRFGGDRDRDRDDDKDDDDKDDDKGERHGNAGDFSDSDDHDDDRDDKHGKGGKKGRG